MLITPSSFYHIVTNFSIGSVFGAQVSHVPMKKPPQKYSQIFFVELYMRLLSEEIFKPIHTLNKELEYAPFQLMGNYFKSLGYKGIIYKSTVSNYGKNIVVFDKNSFMPRNIVS
jgi:hypothetical protein